MANRVARLVPPHGDKNWSFQVVGATEADVQLTHAAFAHEAVRKAKPFLQVSASRDWLMVEFWTKDKAAIDTAAGVLANTLGSTVGLGITVTTEKGTEMPNVGDKS